VMQSRPDVRDDDPTFIDLRFIMKDTGLSKTTIWRMIRKGKFPDGVMVSPGRKKWRNTQYREWAASK
jgi:prophage regulatory protein